MRDFEKYLMEKYPNLFYKKEDGSLECPCGVWVPDGWQQIVDDLCGSIYFYIYKTKVYKNRELCSPPEIKIEQVKEKFAGLRFYYSGGDECIRGMISFAEYLCEKTCEVSGKQGTLHSRSGWLKTLSPEITQTEEYKGYKPVDKL